MSMPVRRKAQKIKTIIPMTNGIFSHMDYTFRAEVTKVGMDIMFGTNYGQRNPSPVVEGIQSEYDEPLTDNELTSLAALILQVYKPKWDKLGAIYDIEYDPIHNYLDEWEDGYNKTWRCWTSRPTDEQREGTPWTAQRVINHDPA